MEKSNILKTLGQVLNAIEGEKALAERVYDEAEATIQLMIQKEGRASAALYADKIAADLDLTANIEAIEHAQELYLYAKARGW